MSDRNTRLRALIFDDKQPKRDEAVKENEKRSRKRRTIRASKITLTDADLKYYDYLNEADLNDFIAEFLSRNEDFRADYSNALGLFMFPEQLDAEADIFRQWKIYINIGAYFDYRNSGKSISEYMAGVRRLPGITVQPPVSAFCVTNNKKRIKAIEKRRQTALDQNDHPVFRLMNYSEGCRKQDFDNIACSFFGEPDTKGSYSCGDSLLVAVNLKRTKRDILIDIENALILFKGGQDTTRVTNTWKDCLMVYDLKKKYPRTTYQHIASFLNRACRNDKFSDENIRSYFKKAERLIEKKEYQKYI